VLAAVALVLARETRGLLVGESVDSGRAEEIRMIASGHEAIAHARPPLTMYLGPEDVLVNLEVQFQPAVSLGEVESAIRNIEEQIRSRFPEVKRIFIEAGAFRERSGSR
jgi:divalent metal cation (Fe/Co/Zn/Cd) transporter